MRQSLSSSLADLLTTAGDIAASVTMRIGAKKSADDAAAVACEAADSFQSNA